MGSLKKNRKKRPGSGLQKHKRSIVAITAVIILLCGMVIVHGMALKKSNDAYKVQEEELQTQIDAEKERSEEINKLKKYVGTDEYIEEVAKGAKERGVKVIIAAAGMAAALPGVIAASTPLPCGRQFITVFLVNPSLPCG